MNGLDFSERTRKALVLAREEAERLRSESVGTEHILLGLIREGEGVAVAVLRNLRVDVAGVVRELELLAGKGTPSPNHTSDLPYTSRAKKSLELAMSEASDLRHSYVGTEHLLLGLLREEASPAAQVLTRAGLAIGSARSETLRILGPESPVPLDAQAASPALSNITIEMRFVDGSVRVEDFMSVDAATRYLNQP